MYMSRNFEKFCCAVLKMNAGVRSPAHDTAYDCEMDVTFVL